MEKRKIKTDPEILEVLSHDRFWFVRNFVAANPSTSFETLYYLLSDEDFRVRFEAEKNLKKRALINRITTAENKKDLIKVSSSEKCNQDLQGREV